MTTDTWHFVDLPVGPQPLPNWVLDARVHWYDTYSNPPKIALKCRTSLDEWPDKRWRKEGYFYRAYSDDGRLCQHAHGGALTLNPETGRYVSTLDEGYAGSQFDLDMEDGTKVTLRGPWRTSPPPGWNEVSFVDLSWSTRGGRKLTGPWSRELHFAGAFINDDLFLRIFARFLPHLRCARTNRYGHLELEPVEGDAPKGMRADQMIHPTAEIAA